MANMPLVAGVPKAGSPLPAGPVGTSVVVFKTRGQSWVEVTDAKGQVALRRTLAPGESAEAAGALPLAVIVGKADVTQVSVRGKPLDLAPLAKDNVARFEVK
jgi:cytoskeleton protein RodZ